MTVSYRTPEGLPHRCPVCGKIAALEPSYPEGDSICPACGHLLWWFRDRYGESVQLSSAFRDEMDSLDIVELVMELEEEFHVTIPDDEAERIKTVEEAIRFIERHRSGS